MQVKNRELVGVEALGKGGSVFAQLEVGMQVMYRHVDHGPASAPQPQSKTAKRKWGQKHRRFVRSTVVKLSDTHAALCVESSRVVKEFSKREVDNKVVIGWD